MTLTNLRALARFMATGDSSSTDFSDADTLRQLNTHYHMLNVLAFSSDGSWQVMGDNKQTTSITSGTRSYTLPTTGLRINKVEIKYPSSSSVYVVAKQVDEKQMEGLGKDDYVSSTPQYNLMEDKIEIFVSHKTANIQAITSGILIYYDSEITELSTGTDEPQIQEPFCRLLAIKAAIDYCGVNGLNGRLSWLKNEESKEEVVFLNFFPIRSQDKRMAIRFIQEDFSTNGCFGSDLGAPIRFN